MFIIRSAAASSIPRLQCAFTRYTLKSYNANALCVEEFPMQAKFSKYMVATDSLGNGSPAIREAGHDPGLLAARPFCPVSLRYMLDC